MDYKRKRRFYLILINFLILLVIVLTIFLSIGYGIENIIAAFSGKADPSRSHIVPLFHTWSESQVYTMFSFWHFLDFINHNLLLNPMILPIVVITFLFKYKMMMWRNSLFQFLGLSFILSIAIEFGLNYDL